MISNHAVIEEVARLRGIAAALTIGISCSNPDCDNLGHSLDEAPERYQRFGTTSTGTPRVRCKACKRTYSSTSSVAHRLRRPEKTEPIFKALINKVAMRRICELVDVGPETLYQRIDLIASRCRHFASVREEEFARGEHLIDRVHAAVDRQEYVVNSGTSMDSRPTQLLAAATADGFTGYILAQHLHFDPDADPFMLELDARAAGDPQLPSAFRKHARVWLPHERLEKQLADVADDLGTMTNDAFRPASRGAQVHEVIGLAAHLQIIARMTAGARYVQLSLDREPGIERLALLSFAERIRAGSSDAYLVRINKLLTQQGKRTALSEAERELAKAKAKMPDLSEAEVLFGLIDARYRKAIRSHPKAKDRWIAHPFPTMSEPEREVLCLSDDGNRPRSQVVHGLARASLRSIDRYFMQIRRKIHVLERPIATSSASFRSWHGYSAYSPVVVMRLIEIFRVVYNYHLVGQKGTTPAQRIGLAQRQYSLQELLDGVF